MATVPLNPRPQGPPDPPRATTVTLSPATVVLAALGATEQLTAEVRDQSGQVLSGAAVTWSSSSAAAATVGASGLVTAVSNGTATITATVGSASGATMVTVAQEVSAVVVTPAADTVVERDTLRVAAEATDANGNAVAGTEFTWASGDTAVATVDASGLVTSVGAGEVEIMATTSEVTGRAHLIVVALAPTTVVVTPDSTEFAALGDTARLMAVVRDQAGRPLASEPVAWASGDTLVASVDSTGLVTAAGNGVATITAMAGMVSGSAVVSVMQSADSVSVLPSADTIAPGDTLRLATQAYDENGHPVVDAEFTWSSSDVSVATVDALGLVRGMGEGTATITATAGTAQGTAEITVANPDRAVLVALYHATDGPNWSNSEGWLTDAPLGEWYGVEVDDQGRVYKLRLYGSNLLGPIPAGLGNLASLTRLNLGNNQLSGAIPPELGDLASLVHLQLNSNRFTGAIPSELGNLTKLQGLGLSYNHFSGSIPPELGDLASLTGLDLGNNRLSGSIPPELGDLAGLLYLTLSRNQLSGAIPSELGNLVNLKLLVLDENQLTGAIPSVLGNLTNLDFLALAENQLTGAIPPELGDLASLVHLQLYRNQLTGPIPPELGNLAKLWSLGLFGNVLTGSIPQSFLQLDGLRRFHFSNNPQLCVPGVSAFTSGLEGSRFTTPRGSPATRPMWPP